MHKAKLLRVALTTKTSEQEFLKEFEIFINEFKNE
jgi:hypothetical protein